MANNNIIIKDFVISKPTIVKSLLQNVYSEGDKKNNDISIDQLTHYIENNSCTRSGSSKLPIEEPTHSKEIYEKIKV